MSAVAYQCPGCGAPLEYGTQSGKLECAACGNSYELDLMESGIHFDRPTQTFDDGDAAQVQAYICKGCGAELMTEETTTATECPYCGSSMILPERIDGSVKPEMVIPFTVTQEQAQAQFENYFKGKALLPNIFLNTRTRIAEMRKLYVPYWLFGCTADGSAVYEAEKVSTYVDGDWKVTETEHYCVTRSGVMAFEGIPVDGSEKLDNKITESLEPYDMSAAVPFVPAVLAGAMADHADVDSADCEDRARQRVESSMAQALRGTVNGYTSVKTRNEHYHTEDGKVTPVLMPVWLITTEKEGTTYTFAINGQTGKLTCDVPADIKKSWLWGIGVFAGVFALMCVILYFTQMFEDMMLFMSGIVSLIAAAITVGVLIGQLMRAESVHGAMNYMIKDSFELIEARDSYTHTTRIRTKIERKSDNKG